MGYYHDVQTIKKSFESRIKKRWLSTREVAEYLDYSQDRIHKLKGDEFIEGFHYHKRSGKLLFDKEKIDAWVLGTDTLGTTNNIDIHEVINNILNDSLIS